MLQKSIEIEADLKFVQDVTKENDGVNYLLVVIGIFF